jgi:hypothetical protein
MIASSFIMLFSSPVCVRHAIVAQIAPGHSQPLLRTTPPNHIALRYIGRDPGPVLLPPQKLATQNGTCRNCRYSLDRDPIRLPTHQLSPPHSIVHHLFPEIESIYRAYQVLLLNLDRRSPPPGVYGISLIPVTAAGCESNCVSLTHFKSSAFSREEKRGRTSMAASTRKKATTKLPGIVQRVIKPHPDSGEPEKAQISVEGADHLYRELRVPNKLTDEDGHQVKLKPGAEVEVKIEAEEAVVVASAHS